MIESWKVGVQAKSQCKWFEAKYRLSSHSIGDVTISALGEYGKLDSRKSESSKPSLVFGCLRLAA